MLISIDTETTGLDFKTDDVIEFAAVILDGDEVTSVRKYIMSDKPSSEQAIAKHHLTSEKLKTLTSHTRYESLASIREFFTEFLGQDPLFVGMNIPFDLTMLMQNMKSEARSTGEKALSSFIFKRMNCFDIYVVDKAIRKAYGERRNLDTLSKVYETMTKPDHSALNDAKCTLEIAVKQIAALDEMAGKKHTAKELASLCYEYALEQNKSLNEWLVLKGEEKRKFGFPIVQV